MIVTSWTIYGEKSSVVMAIKVQSFEVQSLISELGQLTDP
jgi:hypothetical protein